MTTAREDTSRLAELLRREQHAMAEFLVALSVFDRERRWTELGYASLFDFLRRELKLSAGAAQNRKTAARLVLTYPAVEAGLRAGDLCLSSVIELARVITPENAAEILPRFFGKSARDAAFVAAAIRPVQNPPVRDFMVTPVRAPANGAAQAVTDSVFQTHEVTATVTSPELVPAAALLSAPASSSIPVLVPVLDRPKVRPLDAERARINMTVSRRLLEKLAAARDALSHSHPGASEETILELGLDLIIDRHRKRRGIGARPRAQKAVAISEPAASAPASTSVSAPASALRAEETSARAPLPSPPRTGSSRYIPAAVKRAVWERDRGCCAYPLEDGGVCGSTHKLEYDHVDGWALGAGNTVDELRLACRFHQIANMRRLYGDALTNRYVRPKGPRCSEPVAIYAGGVGAGAGPRRSALKRKRPPRRAAVPCSVKRASTRCRSTARTPSEKAASGPD